MIIYVASFILFLGMYLPFKRRKPFLGYVAIGVTTLMVTYGLNEYGLALHSKSQQTRGEALSSLLCSQIAEVDSCFGEINDKRAKVVVATEVQLPESVLSNARRITEDIHTVISPRRLEVVFIRSNLDALRSAGVFDLEGLQQETYSRITY